MPFNGLLVYRLLFRFPRLFCLSALGLFLGLGTGVEPVMAHTSQSWTSVQVNTHEETGGMEETSPQQVSSQSLFGKTIVVDAGHGGKDSGARGVGGVQEKDINLAVARQLAMLLHEAGASVVMTRTTDTDLSTDSDKLRKRRHLGDLKGRLKVVRAQDVDAFVSIHCNAAGSSDWRGATVLYLHNNDDGKALAKLMQQSFQEHLLPTKRSIQSNRTLYLLKRVKGPTVLAEIGFITSPTEAKTLQSQRYQQKVAFAMYASLLKYFEGQTGGNVDR